MKDYLVCKVSDHGVSLHHARRFTEEEKVKYVESYRERGFVSTSSDIDLEYMNFIDVKNILNDRQSDGSFNGCSNEVYIVTEDEWDKLISLNEQKHNEKLQEEKAENIKYYQKIINACEKQTKLYTKEESIAKAKEWNDIHNEGGEGFVPHFYTIDEYEYAKNKLEELNG